MSLGDLIFTNVPRMFLSTCVTQTGLFDFHLTTVKVMGKTFKKICPTVISYRSDRDFSNETSRVALINNLSNEIFVNNDMGSKNFAKQPWIL